MAVDRMWLYDIIYALTAEGGREKALFGSCGPAAHEAFCRSLAGEAFPELWFELPLAGDPWLDFHALTSYVDVAGTQADFAGHDGVYTDALAWFANQEPNKVRQLALSYDTSRGDVDHPAVQLLVDGRDLSVPCAFLKAAGRSDLREAYTVFTSAMPAEWYACYVGVFPGRDDVGADPWVRVECIVGSGCQQAYAHDTEALRSHLACIGLDNADDELVTGVQELAGSPFPLELQFNVGPDGKATSALSASVRFQPGDWVDAERRGQIGRLAAWMQERGLADGRCGLLAQNAFGKRLEHNGETALISCFPAFVKLRWREGQAPDAKAYLMAEVS